MNPIPTRIGLLDHMGGGNLGDDATQTAVIQNIKKRCPGAELIGLSMNPEDTRKRHGIRSYPIRRATWSLGDVNSLDGFSGGSERNVPLRTRVKSALRRHRLLYEVLRLVNLIAIRAPTGLFSELRFLYKSWRLLKSFDLLVISGGGQLLDSWGGPWGFPYTIWKWMLLAKISRVKRVFLNVGAGPLDHPLSRFFVKQALNVADYTAFRDGDSQALIERIGFKGGSKVVADSVYSLEIPTCEVGSRGNPGNRTVGISPMAYCHPKIYWKKDQRIYEGFIGELARFAAALIERDYRVVLFTSDIFFDRPTLKDLKETLESKLAIAQRCLISDEAAGTTEEFLHKMAAMDYVVTCRFHGVIFAHLLNKPVLAISHHRKVSTLMDDIGLSEYCIDINHFDSELALNKFSLLMRDEERIMNRMRETQVRWRSDLAIQFDDLFPKTFR